MELVNRLHLYTGDGKGKTTAAMGLALRVLGHGREVLIAQFMKRGTSGELRALKELRGATVHEGALMDRFTFEMSAGELEEARRSQTAETAVIADRIRRIRPSLTVLDELAVAMHLALVPEDAAFALIDEALKWGDTVVTGRNAPERLMQRADYVSLIQKGKHPFDKGLPAREGIEW